MHVVNKAIACIIRIAFIIAQTPGIIFFQSFSSNHKYVGIVNPLNYKPGQYSTPNFPKPSK